MKQDEEKLIDDIRQKYIDLGETPATYLEGLLQAKPITYWDYIEVETLHSLQRPRTNFKDEKIFIMYHQITELVTGMILHELEQLVEDNLDESQWIEKMTRLNRYALMLIDSFDVMKYGMDYNDYNFFRKTLAPASGFQSVSFRYIELYCTRVQNLINEKGRERLASVPNPTIEEKFAKMTNPSKELVEKMQKFDRLYNVEWPMVHLKTAQHYLDTHGENKAATGGSEWKKYLHPKYQQRKFFPELWDDSVLDELKGL